MRPILPGIQDLKQHLAQLSSNPESYRPDRCPHCSKSGLHCHGCYTRQSDREHGGCDSLNPVPILRFPLSFLPSNLFNTTRVPCTEALVSMGYSADSFIYAVEGIQLRPNHA